MTSVGSPTTSRVEVLVKPGCHLCDVACDVVAAVCEAAAVSWSTRQLSELDDASRSRWTDYVPVVTVDGEVHDVFRVNADRLRDALAR